MFCLESVVMCFVHISDTIIFPYIVIGFHNIDGVYCAVRNNSLNVYKFNLPV